MKPMTFTQTLRGLAAALALTAVASGASAQTLKLGHITPPTHVWHQVSEKIATDLEKASGGKMKVAVSPLQKLGNEAQMINLMQAGAQQLGVFTVGGLSNREESFQAWSLPYVFKDVAHASRAANTPAPAKPWTAAPKPAAWDEFVATIAKSATAAQDQARQLNVIFGDGQALDEIRKIALDENALMEQRRAALLSLIEAKDAQLKQVCEKLIYVRGVNMEAIQGLTQFDQDGVAQRIIDRPALRGVPSVVYRVHVAQQRRT